MRHHVSGAIERGDAVPVIGQPAADWRALRDEAQAADHAYGAACRNAYGDAAYPDSRYREHHTDAGVIAARQRKRAAEAAWMAYLRSTR